jgi:hypothetical protein
MDHVELLRSIHFHDLPVEGFEFSLEPKKTLRIEFAAYGERRKDYDHWGIEFDDIERMTVDGFIIDHQSGFEIFSFDYSIGASFEGRFVFLTGSGRPSMTIAFTSMNFSVERLNG